MEFIWCEIEKRVWGLVPKGSESSGVCLIRITEVKVNKGKDFNVCYPERSKGRIATSKPSLREAKREAEEYIQFKDSLDWIYGKVE
jgi:hypothetical protein